MADIPRAVLSEHFQERMNGRRLVSAVFMTFRFDPAFFEQEILPAFLDLSLSHAPAIKLIQLEDALKTLPGSIAVYYDANGLTTEARPAKLDIRRIPVRHRTGIFHPKNVFALVEDVEANEEGHRARALLVGCLSANLTQSGWWENVEVCHVEEIRENDFTRLRDDLLRFLDGLERRLGERVPDEHAALKDIKTFLRRTEQRTHRSTEGRLHTHFFSTGPVADFLQEAAGSDLRGMNLEILSPYFDSIPTSFPLADLLLRFQPREVRVFLPRNDKGQALVAPKVYDWVREQDVVSWSKLPQDLLRRGKREDVRDRFVHAKVYRFFSAQPKREILFIGSANLTSAAHQNGGNQETGFLVELEPLRRPDWWTTPEEKRPGAFDPKAEDEGNVARGGTRLSLRFWWDAKRAEVFWDDAEASPGLSVRAQEVPLFALSPLSPRTWTALSSEQYRELERVLQSTSILSVDDGAHEPGLLLVQEEGMSHRPSLLFELTPAQILQYWALLTPDQRAAFLEAHAPEVALTGEGAELLARVAPLTGENTLFDRFAGFFHSFGCLDRSVRAALQSNRAQEATYRLFGQKYDSLGHLLSRIDREQQAGQGDSIDHYLIVLCARQLVNELRRDPNFREYFAEHAEDARRLGEQIAGLGAIRDRLVATDPAQMPAFLDWFERWFLKKAAPVEPQEDA
jgi:hypothetical protein